MVHLGHPEDHLPGLEVPEQASKGLSRWALVLMGILGVAAACAGWWLGHIGETAKVPSVHGAWTLPFGLLLASIAIMPFAAKHFWEKYYGWVAVGLGALVTAYYIVGLGAGANMAKSASEYISFIVLLGSLFVVSGGILIRVRRTATPAVNTGMLLMGSILANVFGTTGAAMLLIRPYLRMNKGHLRPFHIVFFIFAVANVGGALTPIGDPPLFLGYLKGVPFWWVLEHCWLIWSVALGLILAIYFVLDTRAARQVVRQAQRPAEGEGVGPAVSIFGAGNIIFISMILAGVFLDSPFREGLMVLAAIGSLWTTPKRIHGENHFNFAPIKEVALLFVGIFATMVPALNYLNVHAGDAGFKDYLRTPGQYFFMTGSLSSVLDNAPTYMTYLESEIGKIDPVLVERAKAIVHGPGKVQASEEDFAGLDAQQREELAHAISAVRRIQGGGEAGGREGHVRDEVIQVAFLLEDPRKTLYLMAISLGAVFFGACTYIGNGPNFMVKSIAEHAGAPCASFFGYILCYTLPVLVPVFVLVWAVFFRVTM
jgi:Na+/H+ antiporter NhaD/arsenite permease-like protein